MEKKEEKPVEFTIVERAEKLLKEVEAREQALKERELKVTNSILGGMSDAGSVPVATLSPDDKLKMETINFFKGSAIETAVKRHG